MLVLRKLLSVGCYNGDMSAPTSPRRASRPTRPSRPSYRARSVRRCLDLGPVDRALSPKLVFASLLVVPLGALLLLHPGDTNYYGNVQNNYVAGDTATMGAPLVRAESRASVESM